MEEKYLDADEPAIQATGPRMSGSCDLPKDLNSKHTLGLPRSHRWICGDTPVTVDRLLRKSSRYISEKTAWRRCGKGSSGAPEFPTARDRGNTTCSARRLNGRRSRVLLHAARLLTPPVPQIPSELTEERRTAGADAAQGWWTGGHGSPVSCQVPLAAIPTRRASVARVHGPAAGDHGDRSGRRREVERGR